MLLSERSEFQHFPIFRHAQIVPTRSDGTRRAKSQRRLSFAFFSLATQRKESGCRATPGLALKSVVALDTENNAIKMLLNLQRKTIS
ncbi:hypothetical protein ACO0K7_04085 [Undibacterium sp. Ji67W]|uniref:hypothetical protein n=1 Tax=Undibacterium sp. Ji67W TaxID=3413042 RepID=UPI003BF0EDBE